MGHFNNKAGTALDAVEAILKPTYLIQITAEKISLWLSKLREPYEVERVKGEGQEKNQR